MELVRKDNFLSGLVVEMSSSRRRGPEVQGITGSLPAQMAVDTIMDYKKCIFTISLSQRQDRQYVVRGILYWLPIIAEGNNHEFLNKD